MADGGVRVRGFAELAAGTAILARKIEDGAGQAFASVADRVPVPVPRRTGALAGSVGPYQGGEGSGLTMGAGIRYAGFVEYGGRGHPSSAQGNYLYPAAMAAEPLLAAAGAVAAQKEIGGMRWPRP